MTMSSEYNNLNLLDPLLLDSLTEEEVCQLANELFKECCLSKGYDRFKQKHVKCSQLFLLIFS